MSRHTPGPWTDSPGASDAIISEDREAVEEWLADSEEYAQDALGYYGGAVVCESVQAKDKPLIKAAPAFLAACKALIFKLDAVCDWETITSEGQLEWVDDNLAQEIITVRNLITQVESEAANG